MKTAIPKLVLAAAVLAAAPLAARAAHDEPCHDGAPLAYRDGGPGPGAYRPAHDGWRHDGWREGERARLRAEFARLDHQREEFHARWGWHPRKVRRFDRWYHAERAALQRQWDALDHRYYAWR